MKQTDKEKTKVDDAIRTIKKFQKQAKEVLGIPFIGKHVLEILDRGEILTLDSLRHSLKKEMDSLDTDDRERKHLQWAINRLNHNTIDPDSH
uniref:Uncharacterized protein n=1 Tax=Candidatus Kentrum sp. LPFa TaxID=2126335 RepID=A0A450WK70_9GAMM|nr:MAG: hypothetical protein BECKLPF1236B_GA0070989_11174 [Candidatus Kentron sp. LPFa]